MFKVKSKTSHESHETKILKALKKAGRYGAYNYELAKPNVGGLAWHRRITELRKSGENIVTVRLSKGVFKYYYVNEEPLET